MKAGQDEPMKIRKIHGAFCLAIAAALCGLLVISPPAHAQESMMDFIKERVLARRENREASLKSEKKSLFYNGVKRTYELHLPNGHDGKKPLPLVIVLHGGGAPVGSAERMSRMSPKADKEGFIVVYPNGTGPFPEKFLTWDAWNCCGPAVKSQVDDVGFIRTLIEKLEKEYAIDPKRIYATGLSNGAMMTYRLGCELSDKIAAIAPVAGALNNDNPHPTDPVSVIIFHGTADEHVLYNGGIPKKSWERSIDPTRIRTDKPVSYAISFWVKHNQCSGVPKKEEAGHIIHETYSGGKNGTAVELYTIVGQGHAWPGGRDGLYYANVNPPTQEISATDIMWDFFARHPKESSLKE